jgi:hypothetical protein
MQNQEKLNQAVTAFELWRKKRINSRENIPDELRHLAV